MKKHIEQITTAQVKRRSCIPPTIPRLVESQGRQYLVYGPFKSNIKIPVTKEQATRHLRCLTQHLQEVAHG